MRAKGSIDTYNMHSFYEKLNFNVCIKYGLLTYKFINNHLGGPLHLLQTYNYYIQTYINTETSNIVRTSLKSWDKTREYIYIKRASTSLISFALLYLYYYARFMSSLVPARACTRFHISPRTLFHFSPRTRFHNSARAFNCTCSS